MIRLVLLAVILHSLSSCKAATRVDSDTPEHKTESIPDSAAVPEVEQGLSEKDYDIDPIERRAEELVTQMKPSEALQLLAKAPRTDDEFIQQRRVIVEARALVRGGQLDLAISKLSRIVEKDPLQFTAVYNLSTYLIRKSTAASEAQASLLLQRLKSDLHDAKSDLFATKGVIDERKFIELLETDPDLRGVRTKVWYRDLNPRKHNDSDAAERDEEKELRKQREEEKNLPKLCAPTLLRKSGDSWTWNDQIVDAPFLFQGVVNRRTKDHVQVEIGRTYNRGVTFTRIQLALATADLPLKVGNTYLFALTSLRKFDPGADCAFPEQSNALFLDHGFPESRPRIRECQTDSQCLQVCGDLTINRSSWESRESVHCYQMVKLAPDNLPPDEEPSVEVFLSGDPIPTYPEKSRPVCLKQKCAIAARKVIEVEVARTPEEITFAAGRAARIIYTLRAPKQEIETELQRQIITFDRDFSWSVPVKGRGEQEVNGVYERHNNWENQRLFLSFQSATGEPLALFPSNFKFNGGHNALIFVLSEGGRTFVPGRDKVFVIEEHKAPLDAIERWRMLGRAASPDGVRLEISAGAF